MKRVDCVTCSNFNFAVYADNYNLFDAPIKKASCKLGKRVMFRVPKNPYQVDDYGWIRYCNEFNEIK